MIEMNNGKNNKKISPEGILFDMDNTLYDFAEAKIIACSRVAEIVGGGTGEELLRHFLTGPHGFENHENIRDFMTLKGVESPEIFEESVTVYEELKLSSIKLYPEVKETLEKIKENGFRMAIVTDADTENAEKRLNKTGIREYFEFIVTPDVTGLRKPSHENFHRGLKSIDASPEKSMVVGDSPKREIMPGNEMGLYTVYAKYGDWLKMPFLNIRPHHTIEKFTELNDIILLE
jgi:putative hydrolase of the HAD superfamily